MENTNKAIEHLHQKSYSKGFLTLNEIIEVTDKYSLPLHLMNKVSEVLLDKGCIIKDDIKQDYVNESQNYVDRTRSDFDEIYTKVLQYQPDLKDFVEYIKKIKPPQFKEINNLIIQAKEGNRYAITRIIEMYLRNILKNALNFYENYEYPIEDGIQEGCIAILKAVKRFNPYSSTLFGAYVQQVLNWHLHRVKTIPNAAMYYPHHIKKYIFEITKMLEDHFCYLCSDNYACPNLVTILSEKFNFDKEQSVLIVNSLENVFFDDFNAEENEVFFEKLVTNEVDENSITQLLFKEDIIRLLNTLSPKERDVIILRFGLTKDACEKTLEEVGEKYKVSRERIRQIENRALVKLKVLNKVKKLKQQAEYLFV